MCVCVGEFGVGMGSECAAGGFVMCESVCVCVGQFGVGMGE